MSLSDAGRLRLRDLQFTLPGKKPVCFRGEADELTALLEPKARQGSKAKPKAAGMRGTTSATSSSRSLAAKSEKSELIGDRLRVSVTSKCLFQGKQIRYIEFNKEVLWMATDVTDTLGLAGLSKIVAGLQDDCKQQVTIADYKSAVFEQIATFTTKGIFRLVLRNPSSLAQAFQVFVDTKTSDIQNGRSGTTGGKKPGAKMDSDQKRLNSYDMMGRLAMSEFMAELRDQSSWIPVKTQPEIESWKKLPSSGAPYVCLKARARFNAPPAVIYGLLWDAKARPSWDRFSQRQPYDPDARYLESDAKWRSAVKDRADVRTDVTDMIVSVTLDQRQAEVKSQGLTKSAEGRKAVRIQLAAEEKELRASLANLKAGALRKKAEEVGCDPSKLAQALGGRRLVDGCGTVEPVSAVSSVQYLRMAEVAEVGLDQPRDLCLLLTLRRDDESGTYSIAMRSVVHPLCPPEASSAGGTDSDRRALRMDVVRSGYSIEPAHGVGAHGTSIVTFVLIIDMKKSLPEGERELPYAWEHWLRNFLDLKEACAKAQES
jgi:hypothetical protein